MHLFHHLKSRLAALDLDRLGGQPVHARLLLALFVQPANVSQIASLLATVIFRIAVRLPQDPRPRRALPRQCHSDVSRLGRPDTPTTA